MQFLVCLLHSPVNCRNQAISCFEPQSRILSVMAIFHQLASPLVKFLVADDACSISNTLVSCLLVRGSGKQQQIVIRIFDDEGSGAPRFPFQCLLKSNTGGLKL